MIEELDYALSLLPPVGKDFVFVDAGAHCGTWSHQVARAGGRVYAIEPNPEKYGELLSMLAGCHTATCHELALGRIEGAQPLYVDCPSTICTLSDRWRKEVFPQYFASDKAIQVRVLRWSSFCLAHKIDRVDLLKVDAEGSDEDILVDVVAHGPHPRVIVCEVVGYDSDALLAVVGYARRREYTLDGERRHYNRVYRLEGVR